MIRKLAIPAGLLAASLILAGPLLAQADPTAFERAAAAEARLDFAAALDALGAAVEAAPAATEPRLARAALHRRMNRPALALDDLTAVLTANPTDPQAALARGELYLAGGAFSHAVKDFDTVLEATPDSVVALIGRAQARTRLGLIALAEADLEAAAVIAPGAPGLAEARAALTAPTPLVDRYDPDMLMDPAFLVTEGDRDAPHALVLVHAGNGLADETAILPRRAYAPALADGTLRATHLFTFTGQDSAIWANLALICARSDGFASMWDALAAPEARAALDAIDAGRGRVAFDALVIAAYAGAGLAPTRATDCAFSRTQAFAYLANWTETREANTWQGPSLYETWPAFVLDGSPVTAAALRAALTDWAAPAANEPAPPDPANPPETGLVATDDTATGHAAPTPQAPDTASSDEAPLAGAPTPPPPAPVASPKPAPAPLPAEVDTIDGAARIPSVLKGIWAPNLAGCIAYTDAIAAPTALDEALPASAPRAPGSLGPVLLTSRRMVLFDPDETVCTLVSTDDTDDPDAAWTARLLCRSGGASGGAQAMTLTRLPDAGPAPHLAAVLEGQEGPTLLQCRTLGRLGSDFAPLWQVDTAACRASAPVTGATFAFAVANGQVTLAITPDEPAASTAGAKLAIAVDATPLAQQELGAGAAWQLALGPIAAAADRLAYGLLLDATLLDSDGQPIWERRLPLLGSSRAMDALSGCLTE